jgi:uncharacterized sulfatase
MQRNLSIALLLAAICFVFPGVRAADAGRRPNILFIQTDDQGPWALGISGNRDAHTPNLDRLFSQGAYLRKAFVVTPVCSPSRASLLTSRYGTELGITDWINPQTESQLGLSPDFITWPKLLEQAGYVNALIGKWHLGTQDRFLPRYFGFQYFMGFREGSSAPKDPEFEIEGQLKRQSGFNGNLLTDDAIRFLRDHRQQSFCLLLNLREPHTPWMPMPDEDTAPYQQLDPQIPNPDYPHLDVARVKKFMREYLADVTNIDRNVGRLLAALDELKLSDNTVVIFTSDHGYNIGHHGILHKGNAQYIRTDIKQNEPRNQRPNMFDTSLQTPTAVRWPGVIKPGTVVERTIANTDWFPTLLAMTGVKTPPGVTLRGRNFLPLLKGQRAKWNDDLYAEFSQHHYTTTHLRTYRTPQWKLVRDFLNSGKDELYHLSLDPDETKNLIDDPASQRIRKQLEAKLLARMRAINDPALKSGTSTRPSNGKE